MKISSEVQAYIFLDVKEVLYPCIIISSMVTKTFSLYQHITSFYMNKLALKLKAFCFMVQHKQSR